MLPLDTTITNTENPLAFQHFQTLNLEQTQRMMSRIQLANYFKQQAFEVIGITPQRLGQQIGQIDTAKGVEQAMIASFAQTEVYFIQHCDYLMPRVHQMRTDLAQYYHSTKPSLRLQYMTSKDEKVNFEMNGTELLLRDLNIYATTRANHRAVLEQMKQLLIGNNTTGASIYDLGNVMQAESLAEINHVLKRNEKKQEAEQQAKMAHEQQMAEQANQAAIQQKQLEIDADMRKEEMRNRTTLLAAEIKAAGYGAMQDLNANAQSDFMDVLDQVRGREEFQQTMNLNQQKEVSKNQTTAQKLSLDKQKIDAQMAMKNTDLKIAEVNKNQFDIKAAAKKKQDAKKKK
jgi:hypothetical protein